MNFLKKYGSAKAVGYTIYTSNEILAVTGGFVEDVEEQWNIKTYHEERDKIAKRLALAWNATLHLSDEELTKLAQNSITG
jgi:hypothetical protein